MAYKKFFFPFIFLFFLVFQPVQASTTAGEIIESLQTSFIRENIIRSCEKIHDFLKAEKQDQDYSIFREIGDLYARGKQIIHPGDPLKEILANLEQHGSYNIELIQKVPALFEKLTTTWYLSKRIPRLLGVTEFTPEPSAVHGTFSFQAGWPDCVNRQQPGKKHSLNDLDQYLFDRVPREVIRDLIESGRKVEFHKFPEELSFAFLRQRGYDKFYRIDTVSGLSHKGLYLAAKKDGQEPLYVATRINGEEKLYHLMLMFRLAVIDGKSMPGSQAVVCRNSLHDVNQTIREYSESLRTDHTLPETIIINYQNSILQELVHRKKARLIYEFWGEKFHGHPISGLVAFLKKREQSVNTRISEAFRRTRESIERAAAHDASLDALTPGEVFRHGEQADLVSSMHQFLVQCNHYLDLKDCVIEFGKSCLPAPEEAFFKPDFRYGITVSDGVLNRSYFSYLDQHGRVHQAMVFRCVWGGDNIRALGKVLIEKMKNSRVRNFIHLGTAGSFDPAYGAGSLHVPEAIFDIDNRRVDVNHHNLFSGFIRRHGLRPQVKVDSRLIRVWSPLVEDMDFMDLMKKNNYTTVEVEIAAIHDLFDSLDLPLKLGEMVMITDLLGSELTLEQHGASNISLEHQAFRTGFEYLAHYLDISDIP